MKKQKPLNRKNYGSIPHLSSSRLGSGDYFINEGQERILTKRKRDDRDTIFVFEKYDGSNVGIAKVNDEIHALTRAGYLASTSPYRQHHLFATWVEKRRDIFHTFLSEGERLVGEWMVQAHGIAYNIWEEPIVLFDYFGKDNNRKPYSEWHKDWKEYLPRLLHKGDAIHPNELIPVLNERTPTLSSVEEPEGMVYRVERDGKVDFLAKWVRHDFESGKYCIGVEEADLFYNFIC